MQDIVPALDGKKRPHIAKYILRAALPVWRRRNRQARMMDVLSRTIARVQMRDVLRNLDAGYVAVGGVMNDVETHD